MECLDQERERAVPFIPLDAVTPCGGTALLNTQGREIKTRVEQTRFISYVQGYLNPQCSCEAVHYMWRFRPISVLDWE